MNKVELRGLVKGRPKLKRLDGGERIFYVILQIYWHDRHIYIPLAFIDDLVDEAIDKCHPGSEIHIKGAIDINKPNRGEYECLVIVKKFMGEKND